MKREFLLARRYLRPRRNALSVITLLSILGVTLGVAVLIVVLAVMTGFTDVMKEKLLETQAHIQMSGRYFKAITDWEKPIEELRKLNAAEHYAVTEHARIRLYERGITLDDVMCCVANGEIIEQYENDKPLPSCLVLGMEVRGKFIHIVVSHDNEFIYLITAYYPDEQQWNSDFKTRRK